MMFGFFIDIVYDAVFIKREKGMSLQSLTEEVLKHLNTIIYIILHGIIMLYLCILIKFVSYTFYIRYQSYKYIITQLNNFSPSFHTFN